MFKNEEMSQTQDFWLQESTFIAFASQDQSVKCSTKACGCVRTSEYLCITDLQTHNSTNVYKNTKKGAYQFHHRHLFFFLPFLITFFLGCQ